MPIGDGVDRLDGNWHPRRDGPRLAWSAVNDLGFAIPMSMRILIA